MRYFLRDLYHKRERDAEAYYWWLPSIRKIKNDPTWFAINVVFVIYLICSGTFMIFLGYELTFGSLSVFKGE